MKLTTCFILEVDGKCLPEFGCTSDIHCVMNKTKCDTGNKNCVCEDESLPVKGKDLRLRTMNGLMLYTISIWG